MKRTRPQSLGTSVLALSGLMFPLGLQAAQLAYEGFDYPSGTSNLTGLAGGSGWNGIWQTINNGSADITAASLVAGASAPLEYDTRSIGKSNNLGNGRRVGRWLDTTASGPFGSRGMVDGNGRIGADGTTVYVSFLQQPNGAESYYEFEFHRGNLGDPGRIAGIGNDRSGSNVNLRAPNDTHTVIGAGNTNVNFYVVRIDFKPGNDDVYVYQNPTSTTEPGTPTLTRLGAADMSFDGISFGAFVGGGRTVAHDEVRLGETWADVTVPPVSQPAFAKQPKATNSAFVGGTVVLTAEASGHPLPTYQWFKGTTLITGQTGATLTLSNLQAGDAGEYHVKATNSQGTVPSSNAQVTVTAAPAGLLAYEGFDYDPGAAGLLGKTGGIGWGASWTNVNGVGGAVSSGSLAAGNNAPNGYDAESKGNSARMPNAQRDGRLVDTSPGGRFGSAGYVDANGKIGADGKTIYISFLQQPDGATKFYEFEFHRDNLGDPGRIGGIGNDTGNATVSLRTGNTQNLIGPGNTSVNFYVVRIDFKPGNDDVYVYQNPVSATEPATATLTVADASDMSFDGLSIAAFDNGRTVKHDEIRVGQSWSDVVFGTSRRSLAWQGDGTTNAWNFAAPNWNDGVGATAFVDGDPVTFNDDGSDTPAVNVNANVATAMLTVDTNTKEYTLGGTGSINSSGGLHKLGSTALTVNAPATFGASIVVDGGDFTLGGTSTTAGGLFLNQGGGNLTLGGTNTFAGGLEVKTGSHTLGGTNTFTGVVSGTADFSFTGTTNFTGGGGSNLWFGSTSGTLTNITIEPGAVVNMTGAYNDALVLGRDGGSGTVTQNGGTVTYNPSNRDSAFIGASASAAGTTATYDMKGGTLDMRNMRLGVALGVVSATVNQTGGSILARQLDLGTVLTQGNATYNLEGGSLTIGAGGITSTSNTYQFNLGAGTVAAAADWTSTLNVILTGAGGNTTFDTAGHKIVLAGPVDGDGGLVKTGEGRLIMNNLNFLTGPTLVNQGTLGGFGTNDQSALTVASGATLAPGEAEIAVFSAASVTLSSGSTLHIKIDNSLDLPDMVQSFGVASIAGANLSFSEIGSGLVPAGVQLTILDASSGLTGTFNGLPQGTTIDTGINTFTIGYTGTQVVLTSTTTASPYQEWAATKGLDGSTGKDPSFEADPDGDGIENGMEWILGGDPLASGDGPLITVAGSAETGLTLSFDREESSLGFADLTLQWSATLDGVWSDVMITQAGGPGPGGVMVTVDENATPDRVTVTIPASNAQAGKVFARLLSTEIP